MDSDDNRVIKTSISVYPEDACSVKDWGYNLSSFLREKIREERERIKMKQKVGVKTEKKVRIEYFKGRTAILILGIVCFSISQFQSIALMWKILALIVGGLLCFYAIFDMVLKVLPMIKKGVKGY